MPRKKAVVVDEETILVDWVVVALAISVIFVTAVAAAVIGWRHKRYSTVYVDVTRLFLYFSHALFLF